MDEYEKLFQKAIKKPRKLSFSEFEILLKRAGWYLDQQKDSNQIWCRSLYKLRLTIQNKNGKAKEYQVKQFLTLDGRKDG